MLSYLPLSHAYERTIALIVLNIGYPMYFVQDVNEIREAFRRNIGAVGDSLATVVGDRPRVPPTGGCPKTKKGSPP
ncbi:MAG: hypothetical protein GY798_14385 [Hyphomicrobiales bacterium]|nr:hypothetical protein [Hyphomicrobiales bacterium]